MNSGIESNSANFLAIASSERGWGPAAIAEALRLSDGSDPDVSASSGCWIMPREAVDAGATALIGADALLITNYRHDSDSAIPNS